MANKRAKQQKKNKNQNSGPKVPPTPVSASDERGESVDKSHGAPETKSHPASPYLTPPTSPSTPTVALPGLSMDALALELQKQVDAEHGADSTATPTQEAAHDAAAENQGEHVAPNEEAKIEPVEPNHEAQSEDLLTDSEHTVIGSSEEEKVKVEEQTSSDENQESGGEQSSEEGKDADPVQPVIQQSQDEAEQLEHQAPEDASGEEAQIQDDPGEHQEDDASKGESDITAELQETQGPDMQQEGPLEAQKEIDATLHTHEHDDVEPQEGEELKQTSEPDEQPPQENNGEHIEQVEEIQEVDADREHRGDPTLAANPETSPEGDAQQHDDGQERTEEDNVSGKGEGQAQPADPCPYFEQEQGLSHTEDDPQNTEDQAQAPADDQNLGVEPEQHVEQGQSLEEKEVNGADPQPGDEQEQESLETQQVEIEPGKTAAGEQEPIEGDERDNTEPDHPPPEADERQEQGIEDEEQSEDIQISVEPADADEETVIEDDHTGEHQAVENVRPDESTNIDRDDHLLDDQEFDNNQDAPGDDQHEGERDVTEHDQEPEAQQLTESTASQRLDEHQEDDLADQQLESENEEALDEPLIDDLGAQSHQEFMDNEQTRAEQEQSEVEEQAPEHNQEGTEFVQQAAHEIDQEYDQDDPFADDEQDTTFGAGLEDIPEEVMEDEMDTSRAGAVNDISAKDIASRDLLAVANLFANMKSTLAVMSNTFERLGSQTEKMANLGLDAKVAEQLQRMKNTLEAQIIRQKAEVENVKSTLHGKVKEAVKARIRSRLQDVIKGSVQNVIEEKVRYELSVQIPEDLRQQVIDHKRQILEVKASLHNSEARRYNALQTIPTMNARLRPLLRPLPTPEQSPIPISISRSSSLGHSSSATPTTAFPQLRVPAPTPIRRTGSNSFRSAIPDAVPPSPSPFFPRDMTTLFALNPEETKRLLREYGLSSAAASPAVEHPVRPRGLSIVNEDAAEDEDPDVHARDLNKFMAHIGVPFLMIPAPKEKHNESAPLSSKSRRKMLTPLIIK